MVAGMTRTWRLAMVMLLLGAPMAQAEPFTFALLPASGNISGEPGSTIGWGYSISNDSMTDWLMLTNLGADAFFNATADGSLFDYPILAPGATTSVAYDPAAPAGLYQLTWDALAPIGFTNSGLFVLSGEFWAGDPLAGGSFVSLADDQSAFFTASVTAPATPTPEPGTLLLVGAGLAVAGFRRLFSETVSLAQGASTLQASSEPGSSALL